jgi:hypothetical protein
MQSLGPIRSSQFSHPREYMGLDSVFKLGLKVFESEKAVSKLELQWCTFRVCVILEVKNFVDPEFCNKM